MSSKLTVVTISHYISAKSHVLFKEARSSVKNNRVTAQRNTLQWPPMLLGMKSNNGQWDPTSLPPASFSSLLPYTRPSSVPLTAQSHNMRTLKVPCPLTEIHVLLFYLVEFFSSVRLVLLWVVFLYNLRMWLPSSPGTRCPTTSFNSYHKSQNMREMVLLSMSSLFLPPRRMSTPWVQTLPSKFTTLSSGLAWCLFSRVLLIE